MINMCNDAEIPYIRHRNLEKAILAGLDGDIDIGEACGLAKHWSRRRDSGGGERKWKRRQVEEASTTIRSSSSSSSEAKS